MKNLIWIMMPIVLLTGCQSRAEIPFDKVKWKIGKFSDLEKKTISVILTNSEPNMIFANVIYQQDYSERAEQIAALIQNADEEKYSDPDKEHAENPLLYFPEQFWIIFKDGSGSVFPCGYNVYSYYIGSADGLRCSNELDDFLEWLRVCQLARQSRKKIAFEQIKWKKGEFPDLKKEAIGMVISDIEPNLDFTNAQSKEDLSEEAARIAYLFSNGSCIEDFSDWVWRPWYDYMWIAFKDGTGSVFECYDLSYDVTYIRVRNITRISTIAEDVIDLVRRRDRLRKEIREGKKEPCPNYDPIEP